LTIHVLSAAAWIGGGLFAALSFGQLATSVGLKPLASLEESLGTKFFGAAVGLLVISGVGLVLTADEVGWGDAFVLIGIDVAVVDGILEGAVFGPRAKKLIESSEDRTCE